MATRRAIAETCKKVALALKQERLRQGISLTALAERAGLSRQMISYVERGLRVPTLDTMLRITDALELDPAAVLKHAIRG